MTSIDKTNGGGADSSKDVIELENGGIIKKILRHAKEPNDGTPEDGSDVTVHYVGKLLDGTEFDSSRGRNEPFKFKIGESQVIKGWDKGVATMKPGELAILTCRADYAYGARGSPPKIPPNATLEFEVELLSWSNKKTVTKSGGVSKVTVKSGDGYETPMEGCPCTVSYTLSLPDGKKLAEVKEAKIILTDITLTEGFNEAVHNMKRGEKSKFFIAPHYGYGEKGNQQLGVPSNSRLIYEIELISFEKGKDTWDMNNSEKLAHANKIKEAGNTLFKAQFLHWARKKYQQALRVVSHPDNEMKEDAALMKQLNQLNTSCASNLALIRIKEKNWSSALKHANKALEADNTNVKAYVRRGQVKLQNGENEDALADFKKAISLDAKSEAEVKPLLQAVQKKLADQRQKERNVFGGMFSKVNLSGDSEKPKKAAEPSDKS